MKTSALISIFNQEKHLELKHSDILLSKIYFWIYNHPTTIKILEYAGMFFGVSAVAILPLSLSSFGIGTVLLSIGGGITATISFVAFKILDIIVSPRHEMENHAFEPGEYGSARLYYQGDIPILELQSDDPYQAGFDHGYLLGEYISQMLSRLNLIKHFTLIPKAEQLPETLKAIRQTIPQEYLEELQGIVDGYNERPSGYFNFFERKKITLDDLILFHLMPDSIHFSPLRIEKKLEFKKAFGLGCTVVIDRDEEKGITFGRNMDWISFGMFGKCSLIINRKYNQQNKLSTAEIGLPGFVGTLTGMNENGVSIAMNVAEGNTNSVEGMPAAFYNRMVLENCQTVDAVEQKIKTQPTLGIYHLSVADSESAKSIHFYQGSSPKSHVVREWREGNPLVTTNCQYNHRGMQQMHMHCSHERDVIIKELYKNAKINVPEEKLQRRKLVKGCLALPYVDNLLTTHKVIVLPNPKK